MAYLTKKVIKNQVYYYAEERIWKDGKSKRKWQKYLGTLDKIIQATESQSIEIEHSLVFELGGVAAYLSLAEELAIEQKIDSLYPKREQGVSIGRYLLIAAINRGLHAVSKNSLWGWFEQTILFQHWPGVKKSMLSSQRFWDNMDVIQEDQITGIWTEIIKDTIKIKQIDLSKICYDGTNYYTFISSFNARSRIPKRGKNKQGRKDLRQVNYALFCSQKDHIPLYFDVYEGSRHDSPGFEKIIDRFRDCFQADNISCDNITIIFDKGNNSLGNIEKLHHNSLHYIGSLKLNQVKELAGISNQDKRLKACRDLSLSGWKAFRTEIDVYQREATVILIFNPNLYDKQLKTMLNDINNCIEELSQLQQKLQDRVNGIVTKGRKPTMTSVETQVKTILKRQYMKEVISVDYSTKNQVPVINYSINEGKLKEIKDKQLGKKVIFTDNHNWETEEIILSYNNQAVVEGLFKKTKNRNYGSWWPLHHYTDQKVKVHGLYCTISLLLRSLIERELRMNNIKISMERLHDELTGIKQVVSVFHKQGKRKGKQKANSLSKMNELQSKLFKMFQMKQYIES